MNDEQPPRLAGQSPGLKKPAAGGLAKSPAGKPALGEAGGKTIGSPPPAAAAPKAPAGSPPPTPAFEFEDSPPAKPKTKASPAPAAPAALNPFADQPVSLPLGGSASGSPPPAAEAPASRSAAAEAEVEADIKPGMAKDLWSCPHCGARNKPTRTTCRECSKSPSDEIVVPWHKVPKNQGMVAGGVLLVILLFMLLTHHDTSLHPAGAADLDDAVRLGGGGGGDHDVDGHQFHGRGTLSVSGRVLSVAAHGSTPWVTVVELVLGHLVVDDERFNGWKIENHDDDMVVTGDPVPPFVTLYLIFKDGEKPTLAKGDYLSVAGEYGFGEGDDGKYIGGTGPEHPHSYTVYVSGHRER